MLDFIVKMESIMNTLITSLYVKASNMLNTFKNDERGITAIEYGLIAAAMAVLIMAVFATNGTVDALFDTLFNKVETAVANA